MTIFIYEQSGVRRVLNLSQNVSRKFDKCWRKRYEDIVTKSAVATKCEGAAEKVDNTNQEAESSRDKDYDKIEMKFTVKRATKNEHNKILETLRDTGSEIYELRQKLRGRALIFNLFGDERVGSEYNVINLRNLLQQLWFDVKVYTDNDTDFTKENIKKILKDESECAEHKNFDAFLLCIMSHGNENIISLKKKEYLHIQKDIVKQFDGNNCKNLLHKPKIFIFQACRGKLEAKGIKTGESSSSESIDHSFLLEEREVLEYTHSFLSEEREVLEYTHEKADIITLHATYPGYVSNRESWLGGIASPGSWFIRTLVEKFSEHSYNNSIDQLAIKISKAVGQYAQKDDNSAPSTQQTLTEKTLTKEFYFFPGYEVVTMDNINKPIVDNE